MNKRVIARGIRIVVAFVGWIVFAWLCSCEAVFVGVYLMKWLIGGIPLSPDNVSDVVFRAKLGDVYVQFTWLGLLFAAGASFALFTLEPVGKRKLSVAIYGIIFALLLPISAANYYPIDLWTQRIRQATFDVLIVLLGLAAIQGLLRYQVSSILGAIIRTLTIFLLVICAVLIPAVYSVIWFSNASDVAKHAAQVDGLQPSWISGVAFALSAMVAVLTFRYKPIQPQMDPPPPGYGATGSD